jgi:hypothetical protein
VSVGTPYTRTTGSFSRQPPPLSELRWAGLSLLRGLCAGLYGVASISRPAPSARAYARSASSKPMATCGQGQG